MIKKIARHEIYKDNWVSFFKDEVQLPNGTKGTYTWVDRMDGVGIVVVTKDKKILLNKEYRYVINAYGWESPGGGVEKDESSESAAKRELFEETGLKVDHLEKLGTFYPLHSFNTETVTLFYVILDDVSSTTQHKESGEVIEEQKLFSFDEILSMIDNGEITDALSANALQIVIRKLSSK